MKKYFYGFYFKLQSKTETISIIPSYSISGKDKHSSLQIITNEKSYVIDFPFEDYVRGKGFECSIGKNSFTKKGIFLDFEKDEIKVTGNIQFGNLTPLSKNIMGPFRFIPFMECIHTVVSIKHSINGTISINDKIYDFSDGIGYIEGDKGRSFPSVYIWTQALFDEGSIMLSVANIPFGLISFTGIIGFVSYNGKTKIIGTYNLAKAKKIKDNEVIIKQGNYTLIVTLIEKNDHPLAAPSLGKMERIIRESASCKVRYKLVKKNEIIFDKVVENASFEYEYTKDKEFIKSRTELVSLSMLI